MSGLLESALAVFGIADHRVRVASDNIGNMATPGYKARSAFNGFRRAESAGIEPAIVTRLDFSQGSLRATGNRFDLAIQGDAFFVVKSVNGELLYTRQGQFRRSAEGRLVTANGHALQMTDGGDVILRGDDIEVAVDGIVLEDGRAVGQIALAAASTAQQLVPVSSSLFRASAATIGDPAIATVRQGMVEGSNVSLGDEMLSLMTGTRHAEAGARLVQVYDDLMGRALTTLGQRN